MTEMELPPLTAEEVLEMVKEIASESILADLEEHRSVDFSHPEPEVGRFRVNVFYQLGVLCLVARAIPLTMPKLEDLDLPPVIEEIAGSERGLVLVTGTTGSGKSTTLAAIIDYLNRHRRLRILTVEDPVEFVHQSQKCLIAQREVGRDTRSFAESLRGALRQDPDFILVGELRDEETMHTAMQAADTGHLVFSTIHTTNAAQTVQRLVSMFPANEKEILLLQLAANLEAVISQRLAKRRDGGRIPVVEIMRNTPVVRKAILEGDASRLPQAIANRDQGMQLFDQHLADLYNEKIIRGSEALRLASNPESVAMAMRGISSADMGAGLVG